MNNILLQVSLPIFFIALSYLIFSTISNRKYRREHHLKWGFINIIKHYKKEGKRIKEFRLIESSGAGYETIQIMTTDNLFFELILEKNRIKEIKNINELSEELMVIDHDIIKIIEKNFI